MKGKGLTAYRLYECKEAEGKGSEFQRFIIYTSILSTAAASAFP